MFIVITHQGNIRKILDRRGQGGGSEGREQLHFKNLIKKDLHTEEVSEGGGGALPEVLPAEVVLLRSLHCATQTRQVQFKTKQNSLDIYLAD